MYRPRMDTWDENAAFVQGGIGARLRERMWRDASLGGAFPMTVHIIEDDPGVGDSLALLLDQMGHNARVYPDAESFFEVMPPSPHDTVIVDLGLPGLSGVQLIRWLNGLRVPPKVIAITGQSQRSIVEMLAGEKPAVLLRKPLSEETLVSHL